MSWPWRTGDGEVFALNAATGQRLWRVAGQHVLFKSYAQSAVAAGGTLYVASDAGTVYALQTRTGRLL